MRYCIYIISIALLFLFSIAGGCGIGSGNTSSDDTVRIETFSAEGKYIIPMQNGDSAEVNISVVLEVPADYKSSTTYENLYRTYENMILTTDSFPSVSPEQLAEECKLYLQNQLSIPEHGLHDMHNSEYGVIYGPDTLRNDFDCSVKCSVLFNNNGVISICKATEFRFNAETISAECEYLNFDLINDCELDVSILFPDDNIEAVEALLKQTLMKDNNVDSETQLLELGYFNLDNIILGNNFVFTRSGIKWIYKPLEIGCYALGDISIEIPYNELRQYLNPDVLSVPVFMR